MNGTEKEWRAEELTLPQIRDIYRERLTEDFPENERKPLKMIEKAFRKGQYRCFGLKADGGILAYAFFVCLNDNGAMIYMLDYYAVRKDNRGTGVGSAFLGLLKEGVLTGVRCVLVEAEDPAFAPDDKERLERERRVRFYLKNGLRLTGAAARTFGVEFLLMEIPLGAALSAAEARGAYEAVYRSFLPGFVLRRAVSTRAAEATGADAQYAGISSPGGEGHC